jgi:glucokinase
VTLVAGVDVGGTNLAVALLDESYTVVDREKVKTPTGGPEAVIEAIVDALAMLSGKPAALGAGAPGPIKGGVVTSAPNLQGWIKPVPLGKVLRKRLGIPVVIENDATAGLVGEWVAGAGRGSDDLLGVWLGTGVGGGLVLDGKPYRGAHGGAGEFGHIQFRPRGALCGCGRRGCIEAYAGRANMERVVEAAVARGRETALQDIRVERGKDKFTSGVWAKALRRGDELATEILDEAVEAVGAGVGVVANLLDVDRVVVGGGLVEKLGQTLADRIAAAARPSILLDTADRDVVAAELGDDSGVVGAAAAARALL